VFTIQILDASDHSVLENIAPVVFDNKISSDLIREFLADPRHHLTVAITSEQQVVGMASAVHYVHHVHPDKVAQMFINEVGVSEADEGRGIGKKLIAALLHRAAELGCTEAWTATEPGNARAQSLFAMAGGEKDLTPFVIFTFPVSTAKTEF
jgi:aminoglycoside 6'-N-acetyltransferase I